ncbi:MAG: DUF512 domain-containing protein [Acidobacteriota bacterium]
MTDDGVVVLAVADGSHASRAGIQPGSRIHAINGKPVRDVLELYFRQAGRRLDIDETAPGETAPRRVRVQKGVDDDLGVTLAPTRDLACKEKCVFCFVHQNPKGLRRSLYFKDDDYRLSFLHGNFVTLTHAPEGALARILEQKLSPLHVSVHTVDPVLRGKLLASAGPAPIVPILEKLRDGGIEIFGQIVLCPGWNDGPELVRTLEALADLHPACIAVAIVPLGLTGHRRNLPAMRPFEVVDAQACLAGIAPLQERFLGRLGTRFAFAADEIYLRAGAAIPDAAHYDGFPMLEDGVGMWRSFCDTFDARAARVRRAPRRRSIALLTGTLFAPTLAARARALAGRSGCDVRVVAAPNLLFGESITVAGLLAGRCVRAALARARERGPIDLALVPGEMWSNPDGITLDDMTLDRIGAGFDFPVLSGGRTASELFDLWPGIVPGPSKRRRTA